MTAAGFLRWGKKLMKARRENEKKVYFLGVSGSAVEGWGPSHNPQQSIN